VWVIAATAGFTVFSLAVSFLKKRHGGAFGLLLLFLDAVFFLVLSSSGVGWQIWLPPVCFLCMISEAVAFYRAQEVLLVVGISVLFCAVVRSDHAAFLRPLTVVSGILAYGFAGHRKRVEARIETVLAEMGAVRTEAQRAREGERLRIASDFHDGPLQSFISLQMRLEILRRVLERDVRAGMDDLQELQNLAAQQVKELRAFVRSMRPVEMDGANLFASARRTCENFQKESGIPVTFAGGDGALKVPEETALEVMQMLRESLHNILKHAEATRVAVSVERVGKMLEIAVDDNGRGFHFSGVYSLDELELLRLGPASLKRRARALNADMSLESRPGRGAGLKLRIPVA
jgi:signal transduction histidine kinase